MKSKEELIQIMRGAYDDALWKREATIADGWEAALKALCGALPELEYIHSGVTGKVIRNNATKLYNQLKQWGK